MAAAAMAAAATQIVRVAAATERVTAVRVRMRVPLGRLGRGKSRHAGQLRLMHH
jgi:hypothetical protein